MEDYLIPILKSGKDSNHHDSYGPIALTNLLLYLKQRLEYFIESKKLLPYNQFGFRRDHSAAESLNHLNLDIHNAFANNKSVISIFLILMVLSIM